MSFVDSSEDMSSLAMTAVERLLQTHNIDPKSIGRIEVSVGVPARLGATRAPHPPAGGLWTGQKEATNARGLASVWAVAARTARLPHAPYRCIAQHCCRRRHALSSPR